MASLLRKLKNYINKKQKEAIQFQNKNDVRLVLNTNGSIGYSIPTSALSKENENEENEYKLQMPTDYGLKDITYVDDKAKGFNLYEQQAFIRNLAYHAAQMKGLKELTEKNPDITDEELTRILGKPILLNSLLQQAANKGISGFQFYGTGVDPLQVENLSREIDDQGRMANLKYRLSKPTE